MFVLVQQQRANCTVEALRFQLSEITGDGFDGPFFAYPPVKSRIPMLQDEIKQLFVEKRLRLADVCVDYAVLELTWGDNHQYVSQIYPGDLLLRNSPTEWIPVQGPQVTEHYNCRYIEQSELDKVQDALNTMVRKFILGDFTKEKFKDAWYHLTNTANEMGLSNTFKGFEVLSPSLVQFRLRTGAWDLNFVVER